MLVPEVASAAAGELADLRAACHAAVATAVATADRVFVVGADVGPRARGLAPWGVDVAVDVPEPLPRSLLLGAWLTPGRVRSFVAVDPELPPDDCATLGRELAATEQRVALVVMGDGSARRDLKAPGYLDPRAEAYDDALTAAIRAGDAQRLLALDDTVGAELLAEGRAPLQVLAGAAGAMRVAADVAYAGAPYGVWYVVATWTPRP
jgi:hypothetical protein